MAERFNFTCFSCSKALSYQDVPGFREACEHCGADVHCCRNCRFYDPKVYNECQETSAEVVREKERSNFCEFYQPGAKNQGPARDAAAELRAKAEALFKKS